MVWEVHTGLLQEGVIVCDYNETTLNGVTYRIQKDAWSKEEQEQSGVFDDLIRISVGIEDIEDLKADFENAFLEIQDSINQ